MRVLIACEFSGVVRRAFRDLGHDAWSCDILPAEDGDKHHFQCDARAVLHHGWDLLIAHPPCQFLSYAGNVWLRQPGRLEQREMAMEFFMAFANAPVERIAIENPVGYPQKAWRKPDQVIHPYQFGHPMRKATCLWLKNLPPLTHDDAEAPPPAYIDGQTGRNRHWVDQHVGWNNDKRRKERSRTFPGIAAAMAATWGCDKSNPLSTKP
jgi:hypothetical protein